MPTVRRGKVVLSVALPLGLYEEVRRYLEEAGDHLNLSEFIRTAVRFYLDHRRSLAARPRAMAVA